jgi:tetratricopeptide (TPR) repeat protein
VDAILGSALELSPTERGAFVERECAGDAALREEVESLLAGSDRAAEFLEPASSPFPLVDAEPGEDPWLGRTAGGFTLRRLLGAGGMGRVYDAWQERPGRSAAVKIMPLGFALPSEVRRFEHEAAILARLRHPCVAHVYESGLVEDPLNTGRELPYFAMELVPGARSITDFAREARLGATARLRLFLNVCEGVHHAHQRGVLHRDLKPSNLLVDAEGRPRIIDFGIARALETEVERTRTEKGVLLGTLQFMSPEQCGGEPQDVDVRSDVYSLGLVLYELVTGVRPYDLSDTSIYEAVRVIREVEPPRPSRVQHDCPTDLDVIVEKTLRKEPEGRYASVHELAEDLRRFLRREPIVARSPSALHRARLFARRNPLGAAASLAAVIGLVGGAAVATGFGLSEARASREAHRRERVATEVNEFLNRDLLGAIDPYTTADPEVRVRDVLDAASERITGRFQGEPLVEAGVRRSLGGAYVSIGLPLEARPHFERAMELFEAELGPRDPEVLQVRFDLARIETQTGLSAEAEAMLVALLADVPEDGADLLRGRVLGTLGVVLMRRGELERSRELLEEGRALIASELGEDDVETLVCDSNLARVAARLESPRVAEVHRAEVHEQVGEIAGEESSLSAGSLAELALLLALLRQALGRYEEARELFEQALELQLETGGELFEGSLVTRRNLALVLLLLDRLDEAEVQIEAALAGFRATVGPQYLHRLAAEQVLAHLRLKQGRMEEAEELLRENLETGREALGATHALTRETALLLVRCVAERDAPGEAIELVESVVAEAMADGLADETTLALMNTQGELLMREGRAVEAEPILTAVVEAMSETMGVHPGTAVSLRNLGRCLLDLERPAEAEAALAEAHGMAVELLGEEHGFTGQLRELLAQTCEARGLEERAAEWREGP